MGVTDLGPRHSQTDRAGASPPTQELTECRLRCPSNMAEAVSLSSLATCRQPTVSSSSNLAAWPLNLAAFSSSPCLTTTALEAQAPHPHHWPAAQAPPNLPIEIQPEKRQAREAKQDAEKGHTGHAMPSTAHGMRL
ncbi:hypothetical protein E2562_029736 [Oryza meyeriana var. granulata]|uniref:Uncharacterized protein n=1 Tax=Oryza meyeriana var. granulata TaxID=110450 RepID=A0A6G1ER06_9ORYZ|nr:hypothetical protein E2562_029736 [Oryza meyeriana var. granulata]